MIALLVGNSFGCSTVSSLFTTTEAERKPIASPFADYRSNAKDPAQAMVLRTKKGDRAVEIELPGDAQHMSDFVIPVSPAFKNMDRKIASSGSGMEESDLTTENAYKNRTPTLSDREIIRDFPQGSPDDEAQRVDIEQTLDLTQSADDMITESTPSYLASLDHIKQLYKIGRYEGALIEADELLRQFPTDPKLHEMRGTLLERLGKRELALRSWNQALRFNPNNQSLRKFIERKQTARSVAGGT